MQDLHAPAHFLIAGFRAALRREGVAASTLATYCKHVSALVAEHADPLVVSRAQLETHLDGVGESLAPSTLRLRIIALRRFYGYLEDRELVERNPAARLKPPKRKRRPNDWLRREEDDALLRACVTPQERAITGLLRHAGLRVGEACSLELSDVDLGREELRVRTSKTDSGLRTVPIAPELHVELVAWLKERERRELPGTYLLATRHGTPMKEQFAWRLVKRVAHRAGVRELPAPALSAVSCHTLRRTFGSDLLNRGVRIEVVSKLMGHADTRTTQSCYAELLDDTVRTEFRRALA